MYPGSLVQSEQLYAAGKLTEAEQLCREIPASRQELLDAIYLLARIRAGLGNKSAAVASYDRALALRSDDLAKSS
jgi:hypothetical protein